MANGRTQHYNLPRADPGAALDPIDTELYRHATHHHTGAVVAVTAPATAPNLSLSAITGVLPAATRFYYLVTLIDPDGHESTPSPASSILTPSPIAAPGAPTVTTASTGGQLASGDYYYGLSAYQGDPNHETEVTDAGTVNAPTGTSNVNTVTLPALPAGADGFNLYRKVPGGTAYYLLATIPMDGGSPPTEYVDDGIGRGGAMLGTIPVLAAGAAALANADAAIAGSWWLLSDTDWRDPSVGTARLMYRFHVTAIGATAGDVIHARLWEDNLAVAETPDYSDVASADGTVEIVSEWLELPAAAHSGRVHAYNATAARGSVVAAFIQVRVEMPVDTNRTLPAANSTGGSAAVDVALADALPPLYLWRIYRSAAADNFTGALLTTISDGSTSYTDKGMPTGVGEPPLQSDLSAPDKVDLTDGNEVQGLLPVTMVATLISLRNLVTKTANYTAAAGDLIIANCASSSFTITLPAAAAGIMVTVKRVDASAGTNTVTISPPAGTIDGAASFVLTLQNESVDVVCDGTNWFLV